MTPGSAARARPATSPGSRQRGRERTRVESRPVPPFTVRRGAAIVLAWIACLWPVVARAQSPPDEHTQSPPTRAEFLRQQREEKAKALKPYERNGLERGMNVAEQ